MRKLDTLRKNTPTQMKSESCWSFRKYIMSRVPQTLCNGPETPTQWKSESVPNLLTNQITGVGARDARASRNTLENTIYKNKRWQIRFYTERPVTPIWERSQFLESSNIHFYCSANETVRLQILTLKYWEIFTLTNTRMTNIRNIDIDKYWKYWHWQILKLLTSTNIDKYWHWQILI